jgi:N-acetylglutamate synthase-like GNAT family acetyltransferase
MSPTFDPTSVFDDDSSGTVLRRASAADVDDILDLWRRAHPTQRLIERELVERLVQHGWFLVVLDERTDDFIAAVHVRIRGRIGRVSHLTMDPRHRRHGLATRLLGVADALCAVFGCTPYEELEEIGVAA